MHLVEDEVLTPVPPGHEGYNAPLVIHCRPGLTRAHLVLFLHGLGGRRYGTWGEIPGYVFEDCPEAAVGLYDYRSGLRGLRPWSTASLPDLARELADVVRDGQFTRIVMIGHSMGGLLAKAVVKDLVDSRARAEDGFPAIARIAGLILMATPQAGSLRVPSALGMLSRDGRVLRAHSRFVTELNEAFKNRIDNTGNALVDADHEASIPVFGVIGLRDAWVDRLSASLDLPRSQTKNVRESHTSIVKPASRHDGAYEWILAKIKACLSRTYVGNTPSQVDERSRLTARWNPASRRLELILGSQVELTWIPGPDAVEDPK
jgi:pimeloyl-ACP methyl ester carboxylesterase